MFRRLRPLIVLLIATGGPSEAQPGDVAMLTPFKADRVVVLKGERRLVLLELGDQRGVRPLGDL